jgi:hypothetical protein
VSGPDEEATAWWGNLLCAGCGRRYVDDPAADETWVWALAGDADGLEVYCSDCNVPPLTPKGKLRLAIVEKQRRRTPRMWPGNG